MPTTRKKYEFCIHIESASGVYNHSKLIIVAPRYVIKNSTEYLIALGQANTIKENNLIKEENITYLEKNESVNFNWTDHKKEEYMIMALCD